MTTQTFLAVIDGDPVPLDRDAVVTTAKTQPSLPRDRGTVQIEGAWYEPIALAAAATGVEPRRLSWRSTLQAMYRLGFPAYEIDLPPRHDVAEVATSTDDLDFVLTPALMIQLQRFRGEWVALRGDAIVEHAATLPELLRLLGERSAAVMKVPTEAAASG